MAGATGNFSRRPLVWPPRFRFRRRPRALELTRDAGTLTLVISEPTPLQDVLNALAAEFALEVKGVSPEGVIEPMRLVQMTLPQVLDRIVPGRSFALVSDPAGTPTRIVIMARWRGAARRRRPRFSRKGRPMGRPQSGCGAWNKGLRDIAELSNKPDPVAARKLEELAMRAPQTEARIAALHALGNFKDQGAVAFLRSRMLTDPNPDIRIAAAEGLQIADYDAARPMIEQALAAERDEALQERLRNLAVSVNPSLLE